MYVCICVCMCVCGFSLCTYSFVCFHTHNVDAAMGHDCSSLRILNSNDRNTDIKNRNDK